MGRPTYDGVEHFGSSIVKSMLLQFGLLERWEVFGVRSTGRRVRARARFWEESHAREAVSLLDNKRLSFTGNGRLSVRLLISTKFKVSARIYDALQEPLGLQTPLWERQFLKFVAYPPHKGYRVLKLEGEDKELVSQAKKTLEQIVGGEVVRKGGQTIWSASLGGNGAEYKRLKELERIHGVAIMRDRQKSQLRLFGPERAYGRVTDAIAALVQATQDGNPDSQPIVLSSDAFHWACRGGFQALATRLGNNKATFDIVSTPKRILIRGSKADYIAALDIMVNRKSGPVKPRSDAQTECSVCWGEAENPIRTSCDHVYCPDCFSDMCRATSSKTTEHRICCVGGQGSCDKVVPLWELQELLSSADFEEVLEGSFASYIRRHPADFQYCSTPDCGQIYRVAASESAASSMIITCPQCMMPTCTSCHSAHPRMTCAEYKYRAGGGDEALERVKKELGAKDCPRCKTMMEKTGGCNHIMCRGCGIHMCWICLATFDTGAACYDHLGRTHQRIFDLD